MTGTGDSAAVPEIDTSRPHPSRVYDYWLGGNSNFAEDRRFAQRLAEINPHVATSAQQNRGFIERASRYLAGLGLDQWLDLGSGIPTTVPEHPNLHQMVQALQPAARVMYTDIDPLVLRAAADMVTSTPQGRTAYLLHDFTEGGAVLDRPEVQDLFDLDRPIVVCLNALLHFVADDGQARGIVQSLAGRLAPGSYVMLTHISGDWAPEMISKIVGRYRDDAASGAARTRDGIAALVEGLEILDPGVVVMSQWRLAPDEPPPPPPEHVNSYGLLARVP